MTPAKAVRGALWLSFAAALGGCAAAPPVPLSAGYAPPESAPRHGEPSRASSFAGAPVLAPEAPYGREDLRRNFLAIALKAEAADDVDAAGEIAIAKWNGPVRYVLDGATSADFVRVARLAARVRRLTGLDIASSGPEDAPNMILRFVPPAERRAAVDRLGRAGALGPRVAQMAARWRDGGSEKCLGLIAVAPDNGAIGAAEILIKDELPLALREACIVEEIVQSLGLMNDDPGARPSIFNDDQEYLALTSHDEALLRMLYDPRIRPGMTRREVEPMLPALIADSLGDDSSAI